MPSEIDRTALAAIEDIIRDELDWPKERDPDEAVADVLNRISTRIAALRTASGAEMRGRDFEAMLRRIVMRHQRGLDISQVIEVARGLLTSKGTASVLRNDILPLSPDEPGSGREEEITKADLRSADTGFMVVAAVRYCLGRHSYAPSLCTDWLKTHWTGLREQDRRGILLDIERYVTDEEQSATRTWECDLQTWKQALAALPYPPKDYAP